MKYFVFWLGFIKTNKKVRLLLTFCSDLDFALEIDTGGHWFLEHICFTGPQRLPRTFRGSAPRPSLTTVWEAYTLEEKDSLALFFSFMAVNMTEDIFVR